MFVVRYFIGGRWRRHSKHPTAYQAYQVVRGLKQGGFDAEVA